MKRIAAFALASLLFAVPAFAEPSSAQVDEARTFFNAGAAAYGSANYRDAVRAFEQAYALAPRPQVLFSLAQAERKDYLDRKDPGVLRRAIQHYREYLKEVPTGGRHSEALESMNELEAKLAQVDPQAPVASAPTERRKPRVTVFSTTPGAQASLDGGPPQELPYFADLEPGKHTVHVTAEGFFDADQEVSGDRGNDVPVELTLRERPALVTVSLRAEAEVYVDGRLFAQTPLSQPLEVPAGAHLIAVVKNGKTSWSQEVVLGRGKERRLEPRLRTSVQRYFAYGLLGTGITSLTLSAGYALGALKNQSQARDIETKRATGNITAAELTHHNDAIGRRNDERIAAVTLVSVGSVLTIGGALLYLFDKPPVVVVPPRSVEPTPPPKTPLDVVSSIRPLLAPGFYGAGLGASF
jgi:tetratricopeptide (TPR) repeat protein